MRNNNLKNKNDINNKSNKIVSKNPKKINLKSIYSLYKTNFIDNCELIIIEKQNNFLDKFFSKMKLIIKNEYDEDIFDKDKDLYEITKKCENDFISDIYWPMHDSCIHGYNKFKSLKNNNNGFYLSNFLSHCNYEQIALHSCGSKFILIESNTSSNSYALCTGCKKCYFSSSIPIYCPFDRKKYYSKIINKEDKNLLPATWDEYHCKNPIINEQMSCIECGDKFWLKNDKLYCKNCKLEVDPLLIIWTCVICKKEFKSKAKMYNPLEYKEIGNAIKEAKIYKKIVKPNELPCKCMKNSEIKNQNFYHKPNGKCKGVLYIGNLKKEEILICSLCNSFCPIKKFYWNCPICSTKFLCDDVNINSRSINDSASKLNSEKYDRYINLSEQNSAFYRGTPLREVNSYVKKKPEDYYNHSSNDRKKKKRNLSITFTNKIANNNNNENKNDIISETDSNQKIIPDNKYSTNNNFYFKNSIKTDMKDKDNYKNQDGNSNYQNNNSIKNSEYFSPVKNEDFSKKYTKIQLTSRIAKKYRGLNESRRFASTSTRNYCNDEDNGNALPHNLQKEKNSINSFLKQKRNTKYSHYSKLSNLDANLTKNNEILNSEVYIPKKKLDLKNSKNLISFIKDYNGNITTKANTSNSVGIRERYKKLNRNNNNFYEKRNLRTMIEDNDGNENNNNISKKYIEFSGIKNQNEELIESRMNSEIPKDIRSSSQCKIEKYKNIRLDIKNVNNKKYTLNEALHTARNKGNENENATNNKHKYNKRYIGNKYNFNYGNINVNKTNINHVYQKTNNNIKEKSGTGTNISNGGSNIVINNIIPNSDNIGKIYINSKKLNEDNFNSIKRDKKNYVSKLKEKVVTEKKYIKPQENNDSLNKKYIRHSFKNGANSIKEFDNEKNKNNVNKENSNNLSEENELKEFNFNDYKIITQLGQGTFGKIYLVQDKKNELFSMKKIILSEELDVHSVINEYKMCQKLKHPNVVKILGIYNNKLDLTTYVVYVLMEVGLTDWEKEIRKYNDKSLEYTERELIEIIKQLSSVLSFLQRNNICHRDIKPQNILVFKNKIYKVADFGEAKQIDNIAKNLINYSLRGTELYMSPLLFNGLRNGQIDIKHNLFKSDVYSLGLCVLYATVTNNKPLYEIRKYVDMLSVKKYLDKLLKGKYSQKFISLLSSMLEIHEKNRPDFIELEKIMKKWK